MRNNDLTGKKFGRLTVIKRDEDRIQPSGQHKARWLCKCDCGNPNLISVDGYNLKSGHTKSCGCFNSECASKRHKQYNTYDLSGDYGIGYTNKDEEFYFDLEDYDKIKNYCWYEIIDDTGYHTLSARSVKNDVCIKMSYLLGFKLCDHIDRNPLNNRKNNFRKCTQNENMVNRSLFKNNKSGFTGVYFRKDNGYWIAQITVNCNKIYLGQFSTKEDAIQARLRAESKYFGEFAPQKHLFEKYGII